VLHGVTRPNTCNFMLLRLAAGRVLRRTQCVGQGLLASGGGDGSHHQGRHPPLLWEQHEFSSVLGFSLGTGAGEVILEGWMYLSPRAIRHEYHDYCSKRCAYIFQVRLT
jgi:hypothetical protein